MKIDGSDWENKLKNKSEIEKLFDTLLFYRQLASLFVERLRIIKELERLLSKEQTQFEEYLSSTIHQYEIECEAVMNMGEDDPIPEEFRDDYYDKNTTLIQHLYVKRITILDYLLEIETLWNNKRIEEITARLKESHAQDISQIYNAKKRIEHDFPLLEKLTITAIEDSFDAQKNETLKESLEEMKNDLRNNGFEI